MRWKWTFIKGQATIFPKGINYIVSNLKGENSQGMEKANSYTVTVTGWIIPNGSFIPWIHLPNIFHMPPWEMTEMLEILRLIIINSVKKTRKFDLKTTYVFFLTKVSLLYYFH